MRHREEVSWNDGTLPTAAVILSAGLAYVGFDKERRDKVGNQLNTDRFIAHYGVPQDAVAACFKDLKAKFPEICFKEAFMTLNWWKSYDVEHVMAGRWGFGEKHIRERVKDTAHKIASLKALKIKLDGFDDDEIYIFGVDGVHFLTEEFRLQPSSIWYDFKSHSSGLKYEFAMVSKLSCYVYSLVK